MGGVGVSVTLASANATGSTEITFTVNVSPASYAGVEWGVSPAYTWSTFDASQSASHTIIINAGDGVLAGTTYAWRSYATNDPVDAIGNRVYGASGTVVTPAGSFQDTFTDTNGVFLENHIPTPSGGVWTRASGLAASCDIQSNQLAITAVGSATETLYQCPSQGSANHYSQCVLRNTSWDSSFLCVRATDQANFIGVRYNAGTTYQVYKRNAGTFTLLGSYVVAASVGDVLKIEVNSSNEIRFYLNTTLRVGPVTDSFNSTEVRQGVLARAEILNPWLDSFEAAAI